MLVKQNNLLEEIRSKSVCVTVKDRNWKILTHTKSVIDERPKFTKITKHLDFR